MSISQEVISKQVGVSRSAVSHVLNGRENMVSAETRKRILEAVESHGYYRNALVRSLKANRTHVIAIVVPEIGLSFFAEFIQAAEEQASVHGFQCFLCQSHSRLDVLEREITALREYRVDGALILPSSSTAFPEFYRKLLKQNFPFVIADVPLAGLKTSYVGNDNVSAGSLAAAHLLELGHRRIAFIRGYHESHTAIERLKGFKRELAKARVPLDPSLLVGDGFDYECGRSAVSELFKNEAVFTALVASSDFSALGAIQELAAQGRRVPEDVSVVGCGNLDFSSMVMPTLTTINQNPVGLGREAVEALVRQIEGRKATGRCATEHRVIVAPELITRKSTRALV